MTIPVTGRVSMTAIATEAGLPTTSPADLNNISIRALAGVTEPGTRISYSDFRGKSSPSTYPNGSFTDVNFVDQGGNFYTATGWTIYKQRVIMNGLSTVGGWPTPAWAVGNDNPNLDPNFPPPTWSYAASTDLPAITLPSGSHSINLSLSDAWIQPTGAYLHGPYLVSTDPTPLYNGDTATFYWKAQGGQDAYSIFSYLLNTTTGSTITMINQTGTNGSASTPWASVSHTINTSGGDAAGNYKFAFISGSWDQTAGGLTGASLYITDIVITRAGPPGFFSSLVTYLSGYMSEFRNVDFYNYALDGNQYYIFNANDMYDNGNYTYPWFLAGTNYANSLSGNTPYLSYSSSGAGSGGNYNPNSTVDTDFVYCGLGYSAATNPLSMMAYRTTVGNPIGFQKSGDLGANGAGTITSGVIYNGSSINGFKVFAFYRQVYGASTDPSVCDLYMVLGHPYWGSVYGIFNTYSNTTGTDYNGGYAYMSGAGVKNLLAIVTLLSKANGVAVTVPEIQTVIAAWVSRIKTGLGYT